MSDDEGTIRRPTPLLRISGHPTPNEVAAVVLALATVAGPVPSPADRSGWQAAARAPRVSPPAADWRASARPG
jgi:hypothetical protein